MMSFVGIVGEGTSPLHADGSIVGEETSPLHAGGIGGDPRRFQGNRPNQNFLRKLSFVRRGFY